MASAQSTPFSLYVHVPFCGHRCAYCDFNTYAGQQNAIPKYVEALCREITLVGARLGATLRLHTVYFGGGTPSLLAPSQIGDMIASIRAGFLLEPDAEITLEANPGTVDQPALEALRVLGVNRLSFGVQSANGEELRQLERTHTFLDVLSAFSIARSSGFENLNADLIYGLPGQALRTWQETVRRVLELGPQHISAYALTLERGTPFGNWSARGLLPTPDPDLAADMYEWACRAFDQAGFGHYEISNWARPGFECRHNTQYWKGLPYLGVGAGAHGYANGYRYSNVLGIRAYIDRLMEDSETIQDQRGARPLLGERRTPGEPSMAGWPPMTAASVDSHEQTIADDMADFMLMGLRLTRDGIAASAFARRFGSPLAAEYGPEIAELQSLGLLERLGREVSDAALPVESSEPEYAIRLTARGRLLGNEVFKRFVD
jgi:oxygen-independent coproporphyrinogen-3 oxidase